MSPRRTSQRGFTLIELMVALVISSLLVGMILSIFLRMSLAYRGQQQVSGLQQILVSARSTLDLDAKLAGLEISQGFKIAADGGAGGNMHSPIQVINSATGPDQIAFYYADPARQALVTSIAGWTGTTTSVVVDNNAAGFTAGDLVVMSTADTSTQNPLIPAADAHLATFDACVLEVSVASGTTITFSSSGNWGINGNVHCTTPTLNKTMIYSFVSRWYRIDPARPADGVLQVSATGNLVASIANFQDLAYGFTDLQTAIYFFDNDAIDTLDPDLDPKRDWAADDVQTTLTAPRLKTSPFTPPLQVTISVVARSDRDVEGITTAATPNLIGPGSTANNEIGDRPSVTLPSATDTALQGNRIYRYATFKVDLRNMGVGR